MSIDTYVQFLLLGIGAGAVYAAIALGLLLTYRSSGVVNFAHAAAAMYAAYVFVGLRVDGDLLLPLPGPPGRIHLHPMPTAAAATTAGEPTGRIDLDLDDGSQHAAMATLKDAFARGRRVHLRYYVATRDESTERDVDIMRILNLDAQWYVEGYCHRAEDVRLFRLDRISTAEVLDTPVDEHADLEPRDLADGIFQPSGADLLATLRLAPEARWVSEYYPIEDTKELRGGGLTVRLRVGDPAWLTRLMLRLGASAELVDPPELGDRVREVAAQALLNYG